MINRKTGNQLDSSGMKKNGATIRFGNDSKIMQSEFYKGKPRKYSSKLLKVMDRMTKTANVCGGGGASGGNVKNSLPSFYHPEFESSSILLPRDYREINAWCRYYYKYDSLVGTAIDCHAELPISTIKLTIPHSIDKIKSRSIQREYEEMCSSEGIDLFGKLLQMGVEYYKLGNVFPFARWSDKKSRWAKLTLLDPDYVELEKLQFSDVMRVDLIPNEIMKKIVHNGASHPKSGILYKTLPSDVVQLISEGKKIPLNTDPASGSHVAHIPNKMADYDIVGTGIIERNFKTLVYKDRLRQSQDAIAARHLTPKHLIWAENTGIPDLNQIRDQVDNAFADPDYAIITNYELHWELIGTSQGLMQLESEWSWINDELLIGLMVNKSFLLGEGSYANGQTVLEVMNQRYSIYRQRIENYVIKSLFLPMAIRNDWAEYEEGTAKKEKKIKWLYPHIKWNRLNFVDDTAHKQMLAQMVTSGQVDMQTWLECFGLDAETVKDRLERYQGTSLDINNFALLNGAAAEAGRLLAPAIAKVRAKALNLPYEEEGQEEKMFANKNDNFQKTSSETDDNTIEKEADTREERQYNRLINRKKRETEKTIKELEVSLDKRIKPERTDQKKIKLFAEEHKSEIPDIPFIDTDKAEELGKQVVAEENSKTIWTETMLKDLNLSQNSRRAALNLENEILCLENKNDVNKILTNVIPQLYASKIEEEISIYDKTEKAKLIFKNEIEKLSNSIFDNIDLNNINKTKIAIREQIKESFKKKS
jgi:hypothetical protein